MYWDCAFHKCWKACSCFCLPLLWLVPSLTLEGGSSPTTFGLLNELHSLRSQYEQSHVPWPCCVGLDTLLPLGWAGFIAFCLCWPARIRIVFGFTPTPEASLFRFQVWRLDMAILCCCGKLRSRKRPQNEDDAGLPVLPPPAKLPAPVLHASAISPGSTLARSSLTNPLPGAATDASVHLGELVVEESDDDNVDEDPAQDSRNRSTSTLQAVKSRIRRHLSQDSLQRQSETEEQIAHRAEVKRLMRKRIQEELQSEVDNVPSRSSTPQRHGPGPAALPGNGPRDTIEFTVDESHKSKELTPISAARVVETDEVEGRPTSRLSSKRLSTTCRSFENENRRPTSLVASEPDWMDADSRASHMECHLGIRERSSLPDIPNSPVLLPVRGSVFHDASSLASWQLSLSADKLADLFTPDKRLTLFRPLANTPATRSTADLRDDVSLVRPRSKSSPLGVRDSNTRLRPHSPQPSLDSASYTRIPTSKSLIRDESPVGLWLRTQSMPFRASTTSQPQSEIGSEEHNCMYKTNPHDEPENQLTETPTKPSRLRDAVNNQHLNLSGSPSDSRNSADTTRQSLETAMLPAHRSRDSAQETEGQSRTLYAICSARPSGPRLVSPGPDLQRRSVTPPAVDDVQTHPGEAMSPHPHRRGLSGLRLPSFKCECSFFTASEVYAKFHQKGPVWRAGVMIPTSQRAQ